jgi:hypothetical protein
VVLEMNDVDRERLAARIAAFVYGGHTWDLQAARLRQWIEPIRRGT